jgi:hypothetical protein
LAPPPLDEPPSDTAVPPSPPAPLELPEPLLLELPELLLPELLELLEEAPPLELPDELLELAAPLPPPPLPLPLDVLLPELPEPPLPEEPPLPVELGELPAEQAVTERAVDATQRKTEAMALMMNSVERLAL